MHKVLPFYKTVNEAKRSFIRCSTKCKDKGERISILSKEGEVKNR